MIHINLLPPQSINDVASRRKELGLAGGILLSTLLAVLASHIFQSSQLEDTEASLNRLEGQIAILRKQHQEIEKLEHQKKDLEDKIRVVNLLTSPQRRTAPVHIFDDLSSSAPEFLWLTEYAESKGVTQIRGKAIDNQTIASFAHNLATSSYFRGVEIRETQQEAQLAPPRGGGEKNAEKDVKPPSLMMTKFLIEAGITYGKSPEAANSSKETSQKKISEGNTTAPVANAGKTSQE
jgi:Tfp pilus assembly protein PilN